MSQLKLKVDVQRLEKSYEGDEFDLLQRTQLGAIFASDNGTPFIGRRVLVAGWVRTIRYGPSCEKKYMLESSQILSYYSPWGMLTLFCYVYMFSANNVVENWCLWN